MEYAGYIISQLTNPYGLLLLLIGNVVGMVFGAIPGLNGTMAMMLFMPMTYTMETGPAIIFLMSLWIGGCSGGFIGSVLLGIPGSPASVATCFDGYPMAMKGQPGRALAIGMCASFIGTAVSAIVGAFSAKWIADIAFAIGPWEYFGLCFCAITLVLAISKGNMLKGLTSACIGLLLASVGFSPIDAQQRFTFGSMYLMGGLGMTAVLIGIFGVSTMILAHAKGFDPLPEVDSKMVRGLGVRKEDIFNHVPTIIRSLFMGLVIGFLPGMGSGLSNLVSYSTAKNASKHPETFGTGEPDGIWAPEVANNASIGGAMIPMAALGIPGDTSTALLIGALTVQGLEMGPMVFRNSGHIVYMMFWTVALCALVCFFLQALGMRVFPQILKIPYHYMYPALLVVSLISAYTDSSSLVKCTMLLIFAVVGVVMAFGGLPQSPLILAFILGPTLESNMLKAFQNTGTVATFFTRPISCVLMIIGIACIFSPVIKGIYAKIKGKDAESVGVDNE